MTQLNESQQKQLDFLKRLSTSFKLGHPYACELAALQGDVAVHQAISHWTVPAFPVTGAMLKEAGYQEGPALGRVLADLKEAWQMSDYKLSAAELVSSLVSGVAVGLEPIE